MVLNIDIFDSSVELIVLCECNSPLIIPVDNRGPQARVSRVNLLEEPLKPDYFLSSIRLPNILSFARRQGYCGLSLRGPGDHGASKSKDVSRGRSTGVWVPGLV
jgi:hypothetical protein